MTVKRFMVIKGNGNIQFVKVVNENGENEMTVHAEYKKETQTELDFAQEAQARFDNENPDWAGVLEWQMTAEEDFWDWFDNPEVII